MKVTIYHNPRCSKSRQTLALLQERGIEPEIVEYLQHPPAAERLKEILKMLGMRPRDLLRRGEDACRARGLDDGTLSDEEIIEAMVRDPILIERPIVVAGRRAALGRPPEKVLEILDD